MPRPVSLLVRLSLIVVLSCPVFAQVSELEQIQVAPPMPQVKPPSATATAQELEQQGDQLRSQKAYLDAIDYFRAALKKANERQAALYNKIGISELMLQRYRDAQKSFKSAIKIDRNFGDAYNNLGVVQYERRKYRGAVKLYNKAIKLEPDSASFYSNLGSAYFAKKNFEQATQAYMKALELDPEVFERSSRTGIAAQMASPKDRAKYDYVVAKLYAKIGDQDHSLEYLRKAMDDGYKHLSDALTDPEFATLRKDARFAELMKEQAAPQPE